MTRTLLLAAVLATFAMTAQAQTTYLRYRDLRDLRATPQPTPNMTVQVAAGTAFVGSTRVDFAGGTSPTFVAPASYSRKDLLCLDRTGALSIVQGTPAANPVAPTCPIDRLAICEVTLRSTSTSIVTSDDGDPTHGYISADLRPFLVGPGDLRGVLLRSDTPVGSYFDARLPQEAATQDSSATALREANGNLYLSVNAEYDPTSDQWNRIDASQYAYLMGVYSGSGIPHEPGDLGGIAWWRATPGTNPIGDYTAIGGWELGWMMTEHRNFVMGGMNLELDGSGSPPYGRFSESGKEDADAFTGMLRNVWYEGNATPGTPGTGSWGRDTTTEPCYAYVITDEGGWAWKYKAAGEGAFSTSQWNTVATLSGAGNAWLAGNLDVDGTVTIGALSGYVKASAGLLSAQTGVPWSDITGAPAVMTNPMTTLGDIIYGGASGAPTRLAGSAGWLKSTGAAAPAWTAITQADVSGLTTSSSPQFAAVNIGHASDTTITRVSAGVIAVEGRNVYLAGGTDVAIADGGTGASTAAQACTNLGLGTGDSVTHAALTVGASTVGALTVGNRNSTTYRAVFTEQGVNAENSAVFTTDAQKGRTLALFGDGAAYFMGRDVTNDIEFAMGTSSLGLTFMGAMTNHGLELRTNNTARIAITGSGNIGFFGVTPVGRQTVAAFSSPSGGYQDGTARQRINDIIAALQSLGLFQ